MFIYFIIYFILQETTVSKQMSSKTNV